MKNERDNQKSSVGDMTGLSKMPEFNEFREIVQQSSMQNETPKIQILKYTTDGSRRVAERLKNYDILEPNEWELSVIDQSVKVLNRYRQEYGNKLPIPKENVKLQIVANETDLSELYGIDTPMSSIRGITLDNGELYVAGGYRNNEIEIAHIIIHEMTHQFAGDADSRLLNQEEEEAATELVAIEIMTDILYKAWSYIFPGHTTMDKEDVLEFLQTYYQYYNGYINKLKQKEKDKRGSFDFDVIKKCYFPAKTK